MSLKSSDDINGKVNSSSSVHSSMYRVGGIAQCLCRERGEYILDALTIGRSFIPNTMDATVLVSLLQEAASLTDGIRSATKNGEVLMVRMKENYQRMSVRAYASWLSSSSSKAFRALTSNNDLLEKSMSSLILLLRSTSTQCVTMSIVIL